MQLVSLSQKVSLITGASSGIGRATAILFARLGAKVALVGRNVDQLEETRKACVESSKSADPASSFACFKADLTDPNQIKAMYDKVTENFKQLDILVNNAAIIHSDTIENINMKDFERVMNTNLRSVVLLTHYATQALAKTKGAVVNVSSVCGNRSFPGVLSYCMSKAGLDQFTRCAALELAPKGVRVNSVNPGMVITQLHKRGGMSEAEYAKFVEHSKSTNVMGRPGEAEEIAYSIAFLSSSSASYTTGQILCSDGGRSVMCPR